MLVCILVMVLIELAFGCGGGGGGGYYYDEKEGVREPDKFGGFPVPPKLEIRWMNFWQRYEREQQEEVNRPLSNQEKIDDKRTPEFGWPESWKDLKAGDSGLKEIPPWAWEPVNDESLPTYCFLPLDIGDSTGIGSEVCEPQERIAYNPYMKICQKFTFSGCGGNTNNFVSMELCTEQCMPHPKQGGCDPNVFQLISTLSDLEEEWGEGD